MPEKLIQTADKYIADTLNKGVLTPSITQNVHATPESFNHTLENMYNQKYNTSYKTYDQFKSAYQAEHGDPFKKKEPIKSAQPAGTGTVATFQPSETRQQIPIEESLASVPPSGEDVNQVGQPSESASGIQNPTFSSDATKVREPVLSFDEANNLTYIENPVANEYLKPLNRAVYDALPQIVRTAHNIAGYASNVLTQDPLTSVAPSYPGQYKNPTTFEEYDKAYNESNAAGKAAMWLFGIKQATDWHKFNEEYMTASPQIENSLLGGVSSGIGQGITMLAGTGAVNALSKGSQLLQTAQYANALSKSSTLLGATAQAAKSVATQPATYVAASQVWNSEFDDAYAQTGDADLAFKSALINTVGSSGLEALPIMSFMGRLDKVTGGGVKQALINGAKGGFEEATTEVLQQALSNTVTSNLYDETRTITDGMAQSGEVGGLTGFALNVIGSALGAKLKNTNDPYEAQEIKKSQEYVQEKKAAFDKKQNQVVAHIENQIVSMNTTEMQKALEGDNITTQQFANVSQIMQTMPNNEEIQPKTIGLTSKINDLLVEKQEIYSKATSVKAIEAADTRTKEIDTEIRATTEKIGEVYAIPSQKIIATSPEAVGTKVESEVADGGSVNAEVSGVPETTASPFKEDAQVEEEDLSDPEVVATKYHEERTNPQHVSTKEQAIAQIISSGVSRAGVKMQGDQNKFTNSMAKSYLKEGGNTIDQVAQQASTLANGGGDGTDISPEDVWDFMQKYQQGPDQIDRPTGNPRLRKLSEKYLELTGKQLNKTVAKKIADAKIKDPDNTQEDPNSVIDKYVNEDESINLDALESDIPALGFLYNLNDEQVNQVKDYVKKTREADRIRSESTNGGKTEQAPSSEGEAKSEKITYNPKEADPKNKEEYISFAEAIAKEYGSYVNNKGGSTTSLYVPIKHGGKEYEIRISDHPANPNRKQVKESQNIIPISVASNYKQAINDIQRKVFGKNPNIENGTTINHPRHGEGKVVIDDQPKGLLSVDFNGDIKNLDRESVISRGWVEDKKVVLADKQPTIQEIKSKKLTHIKGVNMGSGIAKGTYVSTESGNRYQGRGRKFDAEVTIENPYTPSENAINEERNNILTGNIKSFTETDFEGATIPENPTIDDLSDSGTEKLAGLFTDDLKGNGYDSMYLPESKTQEGELVIFDKSKVKLTEDPTITDAMKMSREQYAEKYPEGNYDEARAEYTKSTENLESANKKGETLEGVIAMKGLVKGVPLDTRFTRGTDKIKQAWIKATRVGGSIPYDLVFNYSYIRKNTIAQALAEVESQVKNVEKAINKHLGGKKNVTEQVKIAMDQGLHGETPSIVLPSEVLGELSTLRSTVTGLSKDMINSSMLTDQMQATFTENLDTYLNRSYKKWNDPVWKDNIPEGIMNRAVAALKSEYIDYYKNKYEKAQAALTNKGKRIRDFRTKISNQQAKVDANNSRLSEYKQKHDDYIKRLDEKITKAKKRPNNQQAGPDLTGKTKKTKLEKRIEYLESVKSEAINDFNTIYDTKKTQFDKQNAKVEQAINKAEEAAYNLQQRDYPATMQDSLDKFTSPDDGEISALINQLLYAPTQDSIQTGKAGSIQSGFLKQRSDRLNDSQEIRDLMGEYKDPYINFLNTTHKMITALNNYKFQKQLREQGMGSIFSDKPTGDFYRKIEGDAFKGLTEDGDIYTTEIFEEALKELNGNIQNGQDGLGWFRKFVGYVKVGKTAGSTPGAFANYVSNVWNITSNGWSPHYAIQKIISMNKLERLNEIKELKKLGILGQSINGRELAARIADNAGHIPFEQYVEALPFGEVGSAAVRATKGYINFNKKVFEIGDDYARVIGFYSEVGRYRTSHPEWTETQLREHAAKIVANNSPTYDFAYPWVQKFRNSPWFSTFATFPAEVFRTKINQAKQIKKDLSNKNTASIGAIRLAGLCTTLFAEYQSSHLMKWLIPGSDDDDEKDLNLFLPEYSKANPIMYLDKDGAKFTYIDAGRFTFDSPLITPVLAFSNGEIDEEELRTRIFNGIMETTKPYLSTNIVTEGGFEAIYGYKAGTDENIYSEDDDKSTQLWKVTKHLSNKLEPTNIKVARSIYDLARYGKTEHGSELTPETVALSGIGIKTRILDVTKQFSYSFYKHKEQQDTDKNLFERAYKNARSDEEKATAIELYKTQMINNANKLSYLYHAALRQSAKKSDLDKYVNKIPHIKYLVKDRKGKVKTPTEEVADAMIKKIIKDIKTK